MHAASPMIRPLMFLLAPVALTACGSAADDGPSSYAASAPAAAPAASDADARLAEAEARAVEAEARAVEAEARLAEAQAQTARPSASGSPAASGAYTGSVDLSGTRTMCTTYDRTNVPAYRGLMLCYMLEMEQRADGSLRGTGYKYFEVEAGTQGRDLDPGEQTPIRLTGSVDNSGTVQLQYTEQGARRSTRGSARFSTSRTEPDRWGGNPEYVGTFRTDAAGASGPARFVAIPLRD